MKRKMKSKLTAKQPRTQSKITSVLAAIYALPPHERVRLADALEAELQRPFWATA